VAAIKIQEFKGMLPIIEAQRLPQEFAASSINASVAGPALAPMLDKTSASLGSVLYPTIHKVGTSWVAFDDILNIVKAQVTNTANRFFYTGDGFPKQTDEDLLEETPPYVRLGVVAPTTDLTVGLEGTAGTEVQASVSYIYTRVCKWSDGTEEESAPSSPTVVLDVYEDQYVELAGFVVGSGYNNVVTHFRIYRLSSSETTSQFQYLAEIAIATTQYDDRNGTNYALGLVTAEVCETTGWDPPPDNLAGLIQYSNGLLAGFVANNVYVSEPFVAYAWPTENMLPVDYDIVGLAAFGSQLIVCTEAYPYVITGVDPQSFTQTILPFMEPCVSARGIISTPYGVIYPTPAGLFLINGADGRNILEGIYSKYQWSALTPANLLGVYKDGFYVGIFKDTNYAIFINIVNPAEHGVLRRGIAPANYLAKGVAVDPDDNAIQVIGYYDSVSYRLAQEKSTSLATYVWQSKIFETTDDFNFACAKIRGDFTSGKTVTFKLYANGTLKHTQSAITNSNMFRLPSGFGAGEWYFTLEGTATIYSVAMATDPQELL